MKDGIAAVTQHIKLDKGVQLLLITLQWGLVWFQRSSEIVSKPPAKKEQVLAEDDDEEDEEHGDTFCGICGGPYGPSEFWIGCDICEKW